MTGCFGLRGREKEEGEMSEKVAEKSEEMGMVSQGSRALCVLATHVDTDGSVVGSEGGQSVWIRVISTLHQKSTHPIVK